MESIRVCNPGEAEVAEVAELRIRFRDLFPDYAQRCAVIGEATRHNLRNPPPWALEPRRIDAKR